MERNNGPIGQIGYFEKQEFSAYRRNSSSGGQSSNDVHCKGESPAMPRVNKLTWLDNITGLFSKDLTWS